MLEDDGIINGAAKESSRKLVAEWLIDIYGSIPAQTVRNALMKTGMNGFKREINIMHFQDIISLSVLKALYLLK